MSITVGWNTAQLAGVSREDMDAWALGSHQKAVAAIDQGLFLDEVTPYPVRHRDGTTTLFEVDESTPGGDHESSAWHPSNRSTPRSKASASRRGTRPASTTARRRWS